MKIEAKPEWSYSWGRYGGTNVGYMDITLHVYIKNGNITHYYNPHVLFRNTKAEFELFWEYLIKNSVEKHFLNHHLTYRAALKPDEKQSNFIWMGKPIFKDIYDKFAKMMVERERYLTPIYEVDW